MKILIADDEPAVLRLNCRRMTRQGFEVVPAHDGLEAWDTFCRGSFPAVLTDLDMPGMDGVELIRRIRESQHGERVGIVVFSGLADEAAVRAVSQTVYACLRKPQDGYLLAETVLRAANAWHGGCRSLASTSSPIAR